MLFCIVSAGRSGTTLLQRMLGCHPDLFVFDETHWIPTLYERFGTRAVNGDLLADIVRRTKHVTGRPTLDRTEELLRPPVTAPSLGVGEFCDRLGRRLAACEGKKFWADKTPDYGYCMGKLQAIWPSCKFIHLIRDGVFVANSMTGHPGYRALVAAEEHFWPRLAYDFDPQRLESFDAPPNAFVDLWYHRTTRTLDEASRLGEGSYRELRFEELVRRPSELLAEICDFAGLEACADWISAAAEMIDRDKLRSPRPVAMMEYFEPRHRTLLAQLGYPVGKQ